jgi:hypothetical protein
MNLDLNDGQAEVLTRELRQIIQNDRYPLSPRAMLTAKLGVATFNAKAWPSGQKMGVY